MAPGVQNRMEKLKRERAKTEVVLTTRNADDSLKDQLSNMSEDELTKNLQQTIAAAGMESVKICRVLKTPSRNIKIQCATEKEAEDLRNVDWKKSLAGVDAVETMYGVVVHGVSKYDINFEKDAPDEIMARLESANRGMTVKRVMPLRKRARNPDAPTQSIIIFLRLPKEADECIDMGINIGYRHHAAERYIPQCQIKQCFKCQAYGHKANVCTRTAKCGKCAQGHETKECQSETQQCANCKGSHCAWSHECPDRERKREQGETLKNELSPLYTS